MEEEKSRKSFTHCILCLLVLKEVYVFAFIGGEQLRGLNSTTKVELKSLRELQLPSSHVAAAAKSLQSCPTLCDPTDGSLPGSPVPGI